MNDEASDLTLIAVVHKYANVFQTYLECGSLLPLSDSEACFAGIHRRSKLRLNQSASKLAHSKYVTGFMKWCTKRDALRSYVPMAADRFRLFHFSDRFVEIRAPICNLAVIFELVFDALLNPL